jgi:hypothetical protein
MSDLPDPQSGEEELDLGEIEEADGEEGAGPDEDADAEGDAGDDGQEQEEEGDVEPPPRQGRKSQAQRWRERSERDRAAAAETRRELDALKNQFSGFSQASQTRQPDPAQARQQAEWRQAQLEMMSPLQQAEFIANEKAQQFQQAMFYQSLQTEDRLDKRDFDLAARTDPTRARYKGQVEREFAAERQAGNLRASREDIFYKLYGRDVAERAARAAPRQRRAAAANVARQQTRPGGARGDGAAGGRRPAAGTPEHDDMLVEQYFKEGGRL